MDVAKWRQSWWGWWGELVEGRQVLQGDPRGSMCTEGFSWDQLDVTTSCGIVLVVLSLSWWGAAVLQPGADPAAVQDWNNAVQEVAFGLQELVKLKDVNEGKENDEDEEQKGGDGNEPGDEGLDATSSNKRKRG